MSDYKDRRKHVSFKNNDREEELLKYLMEKSEVFGTSSYIKYLIEKDMKENKEKGDK
jgi:hypothetical protein